MWGFPYLCQRFVGAVSHVSYYFCYDCGDVRKKSSAPVRHTPRVSSQRTSVVLDPGPVPVPFHSTEVGSQSNPSRNPLDRVDSTGGGQGTWDSSPWSEVVGDCRGVSAPPVRVVVVEHVCCRRDECRDFVFGPPTGGSRTFSLAKEGARTGPMSGRTVLYSPRWGRQVFSPGKGAPGSASGG